MIPYQKYEKLSKLWNAIKTRRTWFIFTKSEKIYLLQIGQYIFQEFWKIYYDYSDLLLISAHNNTCSRSKIKIYFTCYHVLKSTFPLMKCVLCFIPAKNTTKSHRSTILATYPRFESFQTICTIHSILVWIQNSWISFFTQNSLVGINVILSSYKSTVFIIRLKADFGTEFWVLFMFLKSLVNLFQRSFCLLWFFGVPREKREQSELKIGGS